MTLDKDSIVFVPHPTDSRFRDLTGKRFHRLVVLGHAGKVNKSRHWFCLCDCGNFTRVAGGALRDAETKSCGCGRSLENKRRTTHGRSHTPEYHAYAMAKARCENPNEQHYADYGGRGIKFLFTSFEEFFAEIGERPTPKHSIDRKDNEGNYEMGNVRWATQKEQNRNQRSNHRITIEGVVKTLTEWCEIKNTTPPKVFKRLERGFCVPCAFIPRRGHRCNHTA